MAGLNFRFTKNYPVVTPFFIFLIFSSQIIAQQKNKITITNDGWELKGDLVPADNNGAKCPVVILLNKANGDRKCYETLAGLLAKNGISSLSLDLRGHGESINKGKFIPFDSTNNIKIKLEDTYTDIIAAHKYLCSLKQTDTNKIGFVGASYSAEEMMAAARQFKYGKCYVALSPGSFSDESIMSIDHLPTTMLFIKSSDEKFLQGFEKKIFSKSKNAEILFVSGDKHATDILSSNPDITALIASWMKDHL